MDPAEKAKLIVAKVEILKLKADDYNWKCMLTDELRHELEQALVEINHLLDPNV